MQIRRDLIALYENIQRGLNVFLNRGPDILNLLNGKEYG